MTSRFEQLPYVSRLLSLALRSHGGPYPLALLVLVAPLHIGRAQLPSGVAKGVLTSVTGCYDCSIGRKLIGPFVTIQNPAFLGKSILFNVAHDDIYMKSSLEKLFKQKMEYFFCQYVIVFIIISTHISAFNI